MRYSSSLLAAALASPLIVSAAPVRSRAASAADALVFQFANVLEQLETSFYQQGIAKFQDSDFQAAGFSSSLIATQTLTTIQQDEATHTTFLQQALTDVPTMAATARAVEYVGVAAYLGAATLLDDPVFLDAAGSILTVEARHQTLLNILAGASSIPQAFDIPLTPQEVLSIAGGFITGDCNTGVTRESRPCPEFPILTQTRSPATNPLTVTNTGAPKPGDLVTVSATNITGTDGLFCNMMVGGAPFSINLPLAQCVVPQGINGVVALWITSDDQPLANNVVDRATSQQIAGPALLFVDTQPEMLGAMVRGSGTSGGAGSSTETTTISPDEASSIIAGAAATATSGSSSDSGSSNGAAAAPAAPASTPLPTNFTGESPDKKVTVNGIKMVPNPNLNGAAAASGSASSDGSSASSTDSAAPTSSSN
ncbi:ferritin-like domain-containing protein [Mycena filopes]|nr:ferritin-like domain-containing protein [Mycena filopes]